MKQEKKIMRYKHHQRVAIPNPISHSREGEKNNRQRPTKAKRETE